MYSFYKLYTHLFVWLDQKYQCKDGHALVSDGYFSLLCPPIEKIISQSPSMLNGVPSLSSSPSTTLSKLLCMF